MECKGVGCGGEDDDDCGNGNEDDYDSFVRRILIIGK